MIFVRARVSSYEKFSNFFVEHGSRAFPFLIMALFGMFFTDKIRERIHVSKDDLADAYDKYDAASNIWDIFSDLFDNDYCGCGFDLGGCDGCGLDGCF